jgi:hypothetical protein
VEGLTWADYVRARALVFPAAWETWADVPPTEYRRLTRNWRRWRQRRLKEVFRASQDEAATAVHGR